MTRTCMLGENFSLVRNTICYLTWSVHSNCCLFVHQHVLSLFWSHSVPQRGSTALMYASRKGHSDAARALVSAGARVDLQDEVRCSICVLRSSWTACTCPPGQFTLRVSESLETGTNVPPYYISNCVIRVMSCLTASHSTTLSHVTLIHGIILIL